MRITKKMLDAGSEVLWERVAESYDDDYRDLIARLFRAMLAASVVYRKPVK